MLGKNLLILCVLCAALMIGCFTSPRTANNAPTSNSNAGSSAPAAAVEKIGIPECDEFVAKYETCIAEHVPDAKKKEYQENIDVWRSIWRDMAARSNDKATLAAACKRKVEQALEALKSFNCEL